MLDRCIVRGWSDKCGTDFLYDESGSSDGDRDRSHYHMGTL